MKRIRSFLFFSSAILMLMAAASCTKEGPQGVAGKDGTNGTDGTDGTTSCIECHSSNQLLYAIENQYAASFHAYGPDFERNEGECAICHTSQGFRGNLDGSFDWTAPGAKIENPTGPNCYTCHEIHESYTAADLALTVKDAVELNNTGGATHDFGRGNLCASCHQSRVLDPFPVAGGADIVVTSPYWGVHHGTQGNAVAGVGMGLFDIGDGLTNSVHSGFIANSCVTCHMAEAYGTQSGGHSMWMGYDYHGSTVLNTASCNTTGCHGDGEDVQALTEEFQGEIAGLLAELKMKLDATGITVEGSDAPVPGTYAGTIAGACINYKALTEDKSLGVHNPKYIKKLLQNTIVALD